MKKVEFYFLKQNLIGVILFICFAFISNNLYATVISVFIAILILFFQKEVILRNEKLEFRRLFFKMSKIVDPTEIRFIKINEAFVNKPQRIRFYFYKNKLLNYTTVEYKNSIDKRAIINYAKENNIQISINKYH